MFMHVMYGHKVNGEKLMEIFSSGETLQEYLIAHDEVEMDEISLFEIDPK